MKAAKAPAGDPQALFQRAVAEYEAGRFQRARKVLMPLLELPDPGGQVALLAGLVDAGLGEWKSAERRLDTAVKRSPQRLEAWMGLGNVRHMLGDRDGAVEAYRRAIELRPDDAAGWNNLGVVYADMRRDHDAILCFDRALERAPMLASAQRGRAESLARVGRFEQARTAYRELIGQRPDDAGLALDYAGLLERANRRDEALAALPDAAALRQPDRIARREALHARLLARAGDLDGALRVVRAAQRKTREDWLGYLEGSLLDRQGDAARAMAAFRRGNAARTRHRTYRRLHEQGMLDYLDYKIGQGIAPRADTGTAEAGESPVFIVGLPRSGTTLLDRMLAAHPEVQVLEEPESLRVAEAVIAAGGRASEARTRYWEYLEDTIGLEPGRLVVDKNPLHALHLDHLPALFPRARVVYSLRHPYDAALSCYMQDFALNAATVHCLDLESTAGLCARLLRMMQLYESACPERVHRIRYEDLVRGDYRQSLGALLCAIGLSWHDDIEDFADQAAQSGLITTASYEQVTRGLYTSSVERWRRYREWLQPFRETLGPVLEYWGYDA